MARRLSLLASIGAAFMNTLSPARALGLSWPAQTRFIGLMPPNPLNSLRRSRRPVKYWPHQGKQGCARRIRQGKA